MKTSATNPGGREFTREQAGDESIRQRSEIEHWFLRRGLPQFIVDYEGTGDFVSRALPLMIAAFLFQVFLAVNIRWGVLANIAAVIGGMAILVAVWGASNLTRRRPVLSRPERLGIGELAVFVAGPAILPLVFGFQWRQAIWVAAINAAIVAIIYGAASFALFPMMRWALVSIGRQVAATVEMAARALPLLLIVVIFLFFTQETWQLAGALDEARLALVSSFFFAVGCIFLLSRIPGQVGGMAGFAGWGEVRSGLSGTEFEDMAPPAGPFEEVEERIARLARREWINVVLVLLFRQAMQIGAVTVTLGLFYVALGTFVVDIPLQSEWVGHPVTTLVDVTLWGRKLALTEDVLKIAGFLTAFSGLFLTVQVLTDKTYREEFMAEVDGEIHQALALRLIYRSRFAAAA